MSEFRAFLCVVLIMLTLGWAFWYGSQRADTLCPEGVLSSQGVCLDGPSVTNPKVVTE